MPMRHVPGMPMAYARMIEEFQSSVSNFDRLHDMQRRNMMALAESNKLSLDVMQAFARRQAQIMERTTAMFADAAGEMLSARNPATMAQKQLAVAHDAFRLAQAELKAFVQIAAQARDDARRIWRKDDAVDFDESEISEIVAETSDEVAAAEPAPEPAPEPEPALAVEPVAVTVTMTETVTETVAETPVVAAVAVEDDSAPQAPVVIETKTVVTSVARPRRSGSRRKAVS